VGSVLCSDLEEELGNISALCPIRDIRTARFCSRHSKTGLSCVAVMRLIAVRSFDALVYPTSPRTFFLLAPPSSATEAGPLDERILE